MKKIVMSLVSVMVFALAACTPAANNGNPLANLAGSGAGSGLGVGGKLTKAQLMNWADCLISKATPEEKASVQQIKTLWSQIPDAAFETAVTPQQLAIWNTAYAKLGCSF